jgi:CHASE3 domain sensor protein
VKSIPSRSRGKVGLGLWLALALLVVMSILPYLSLQQLREATRWRVHTYEVIDALDRLRSGLQDAQSSSRGFVITGRQDFLEPYEGALTTIDRASAAVERLTVDNPSQQKSLGEIRVAITEWIAHNAATVQVRAKAALRRPSRGLPPAKAKR